MSHTRRLAHGPIRQSDGGIGGAACCWAFVTGLVLSLVSLSGAEPAMYRAVFCVAVDFAEVVYGVPCHVCCA
jgi:hypothetical protein